MRVHHLDWYKHQNIFFQWNLERILFYRNIIIWEHLIVRFEVYGQKRNTNKTNLMNKDEFAWNNWASKSRSATYSFCRIRVCWGSEKVLASPGPEWILEREAVLLSIKSNEAMPRSHVIRASSKQYKHITQTLKTKY